MKIIDGKPEYRGAVVRFNLQVIFTILYGYFLICGVHITTYVIFGVLMIHVFVFSGLKLFRFQPEVVYFFVEKKKIVLWALKDNAT